MIALTLFFILKIFNVISLSWWWLILGLLVEVFFYKNRISKIDKLFKARIDDIYNQLPEKMQQEIDISEVEDILHQNYYLSASEVINMLKEDD